MNLRNIVLAGLFLAPVSAMAGDLVLKLGTNNDPRIPITGLVTVNPASGDVIVDPVANSGVSGDGWCPTGGTSPTAPSFTTAFSANTSSLPVGGGSVSLSWATANTTGCTASSSPTVTGWNGAVGTSGPASISLTASGTYTFSLYCSGSGGNTSTYSRQVVVATSTTTSQCQARPAPTTLTRETVFMNTGVNNTPSNYNLPPSTVSLTTLDPVLGPFGGTVEKPNDDAYIPIDVNKYVALQFSTSSVTEGVTGRFIWEQPTSGGKVLTVMVSPCPGDFNYVVDAKCKVTRGYGSINWKVTSGSTTNCKLEPNTTYYLNAAFVSGDTYTTNTCDGGVSNCKWLISNQRF